MAQPGDALIDTGGEPHAEPPTPLHSPEQEEGGATAEGGTSGSALASTSASETGTQPDIVYHTAFDWAAAYLWVWAEPQATPVEPFYAPPYNWASEFNMAMASAHVALSLIHI